jgi:hypothetical protein
MAPAIGPGPAGWRRAGTLAQLTRLTPCMPCSFGHLPHPRSEPGAQSIELLEVTVTIRWIPLVTAACGTWVARRVRTTLLTPGGEGSQLDSRVRSVLGGDRSVGKPRKAAEQRDARITVVAALRRAAPMS